MECICGFNHPNVLVKRIDSHTISQAVMKRTAHWLVVSTALKSMSSSVGVTIPNIWKNKIHVPNHQPAHVLIDAVATCTYIILYPSDRTSVWPYEFTTHRHRTLLRSHQVFTSSATQGLQAAAGWGSSKGMAAEIHEAYPFCNHSMSFLQQH